MLRTAGTMEDPDHVDICVGALKYSTAGTYDIVCLHASEGYSERGRYQMRRYLALKDDETWKQELTLEPTGSTTSPLPG